ncbi:MAG: hypothetical protein LC745_08490, partial [Planctomycetia bacterium]|nr:hypothetical protein [Planctomycetia bacterium]
MSARTAPVFERMQPLRKAGLHREALGLLRDALRRGELGPEGIDKAGRLVRKALEEGADTGNGVKPVDVLVLGQCTTSWLVNALAASGWGGNLPLRVTEGGYDNVLQDLDRLSRSGPRPDVVVLLPWGKRLFESPGDPEQVARDEVAFWEQAWGMVKGGLQAALVQVGYDWVVPGPLGHHLGARPGGPVDLVRRVNARLLASLPGGAYFVDLEQTSAERGRSSFYDMRRYYWTKQPFSEAGTCDLAGHLLAGVRAVRT